MMTRPTYSRRRRGAVLILVLWMVVVLGMVGLSYLASVQTQMQTSAAARGRHMAQWAARAGVERAMAELAQTSIYSINDLSSLLGDETMFKDQPAGQAAYTLLGAPDADGQPRYGVMDESARISINRAGEAMLRNLNGVTAEMAESLIDWRDSDSDPLSEGAESDYYQSLTYPYSAKNAAFESVRELLRVKGWAPIFNLAYPDPYQKFSATPADEEPPTSTNTAAGADQGNTQNTAAGQNGGSGQGSGSGGSANGPGDSDPIDPASGTSTGDALTQADARTLLDSLTAWSASPLKLADGAEKVDLKNANENQLLQGIPGLTQQEAQAIVAWKQQGQGFQSSPVELLDVTMRSPNQPRTEQNPKNNQKVFSLKRVGEIIDYCTVQASQDGALIKTGLININTASRKVLLAIPGMTEELADQIIAQRSGDGAIQKPGDITGYQGITEANFRSLYRWIGTASTRFHVISQGVDPGSQAVVTVDAVLAFDDQKKITIAYWREY